MSSASARGENRGNDGLLTLRCLTAWICISSTILAAWVKSTSTMRTWSLTWKYAENTPSRSILSRSLAFGELLCASACPDLGSILLARLSNVV